MNAAQVREEITLAFSEMFGLTPDQLKGDALLEEDLDLDSIDAVDLIATLEKKSGRRIGVEAFQSIKTLDDLVAVVTRALGDA